MLFRGTHIAHAVGASGPLGFGTYASAEALHNAQLLAPRADAPLCVVSRSSVTGNLRRHSKPGAHSGFTIRHERSRDMNSIRGE